MGDESIHDLTPAFALDALDELARRDYVEHLARCLECRVELAQLTEAAGKLAYAAPPAEASGGLRERILDAARTERSNVVTLRPRWLYSAVAAAAVAAGVAIGVGVWAASLSSSLHDTRLAATRDQRALALLTDPSSRQVTLTGAHGALVVAPDGNAHLVVFSLPHSSGSRTYEAWVINRGKALPAGLFEGGQTTIVPLRQPVTAGRIVAVTLEPRGGSKTPTRPLLFSTRA